MSAPLISRRPSPLAWLLIQPIRFYQRFISRYTPPTCRYYPCCSNYAVTALAEHGALFGSWLTARRLLRCNPWSAGGIDHVPARRGQAAGRQDLSTAGTAAEFRSAGQERGTAAGSSSSDLRSPARTMPAGAPTAGSSAA